MPDAVYIGDENGITECNTLGWTMLGFESAEDVRRSRDSPRT
jgi:PAS domain-containing protein